jgi:phage FluMu protein Com
VHPVRSVRATQIAKAFNGESVVICFDACKVLFGNQRRNAGTVPALDQTGRYAMDRVTRCLHCGRRLVPVLSADGRTELKCAWCDNVDPMETETAKWADSPLAKLFTSRPSSSSRRRLPEEVPPK